jgi:predicted RNA-binding Zn-ribbon protein involved in translation (DUF1610 family)
MPVRRKIDLEKIWASLALVCPHCSARIEPQEFKRLDGERLECPWCGETFIPVKRERPLTDY